MSGPTIFGSMLWGWPSLLFRSIVRIGKRVGAEKATSGPFAEAELRWKHEEAPDGW